MKTRCLNSSPAREVALRSLRSLSRFPISIRRLRQTLVVALMVALVLTALPLVERVTPPAQAQITVVVRTCDPTHFLAPGQIIQGCKLGGLVPENTLESAVIDDLLKLHRLPASDRARLLGWERDAIRAGIYDKVISLIKKAPDQRTFNERSIVNAVGDLVKARRVLAATKALDEFNRWRVTCPYTPPSSDFTYTESPLCGGGLGGLFGGRTPPTFAEFQAYGAYLAHIDLKNKPEIQQSARNMGLAYGYLGGMFASGVAGAVGAGIGAALGKTALVSAILPFAGVKAASAALAGAVTIAAPVAIIIFAVTVGVIRGIQVFEQEKIPEELQKAKDAAINSTIDLAQLIANDRKEGLNEIYGEVLQASFPDFPATSGVPAAQASDPQFEFRPGSSPNFSSTPSIEYKDYDGNPHTARLNGGWFVDRKSGGTERLTLSIQFLNAEGRKRVATRTGSFFLISDISADEADAVYTAELHYRNWQDQTYVARIPNISPVITVLPVERHQEPPAPTTVPSSGMPTNFNVSHIANISDNDSLEVLNIAITSPLTSNGVTLSEFRVDPDGKVFARIQPSCSASDASFTLEVTDSGDVKTTETIKVTVTRNEAPVLEYESSYAMPERATQIILPKAGPSDDNTYWGLGYTPAWELTAVNITPLDSSKPAFTGTVKHATQVGNTIYLNPAGPIEVRDAGPIGAYRVKVLIEDSCFKVNLAEFILNVTCAAPAFTYTASNPTCDGARNGQITLNASGGTGSLLYSIDNGNSFHANNVFTGLAPGDYFVSVKDTAACSAATQKVTLINPAPVTFTATPTNPVCHGASNGQIVIAANGGTGAYQYSMQLPGGGIKLQSNNSFTGLAAGDYFVSVKDANDCWAATQKVTLSQPAPFSAQLGGGGLITPGLSANLTVTLTGGTAPYTVKLSNGATRTGNGPFNFIFDPQTTTTYTIASATDSIGCHATLSGSATITVDGTPPTISCPANVNGNLNLQQGTATINTGTATATDNVTASPAITGARSDGYPLSSFYPKGTTSITWRAVDEVSNSSTCTQTVTVNCPTISLPSLTGAGRVGAFYNQLLSASPTGNHRYSVSGTLPPGLTLEPTTGSLSGRPSQSGQFDFTVTTTSFGCSGSRSYSMTIECPVITLSPGNLSNGTAGVNYSASISATPSGTYSYIVADGALPNGLTLNSANGAISGRPTQTGTFSFRVTATGPGSCDSSRDYEINIACPVITLSSSPLANATFGSSYSQMVSAAPAGGNYSFALTGGALPPGLALASNGQISGKPSQTGTFSFRLTATGFGGCSNAKDYQLTVVCPAITLSAGPLAGSTVGAPYAQTISATGAGDNYAFAIASGALPPGLSLTQSGQISGTPTQSGIFNFRVSATGAGGCAGTSSYSINISCPAITLAPAGLPGGDFGTAYHQTLGASPAVAYTYNITSGALPSGLALNQTTGVISGTPTAVGTFNFIVKATSGGCSGSRSYTMTIACPTITLNPETLAAARRAAYYSQTISATPGGGTYSYMVTSGSLPAGLNLNMTTGVLSGTPTMNGTYSFTIRATRSGTGCTGSRNYIVTVNDTGITAAVNINDYDGDGRSDFIAWSERDWLIVSRRS